ncbi:MAG: gluconate 2-dehydrogenase subunit 3 family protein [Acidobacteria bacterium]|nr:gluconate 2-dehydrogenase subunit 3 family protein [Acidobacteriota bacterium]
MKFTRRAALELSLALWARAEEQAHQHGSTKENAAVYRFRFLGPAEVTTIQRFAAVMIPPSGRSGGAAAAHVSRYIDHILASATPSLGRQWRRGLADWAKAKDEDKLLGKLAVNEFAPKSREDQFFVLFKSALTAGFYTSEEGILQELGYQGMGFLREFPGYQGEEFVKPANYKPLLRSI